MRSFLFALLAPSFVFATGVTPGTLEKTPDGKTVDCQQASDIQRIGYRPTQFDLDFQEPKVKFNVVVVSIVCSQTNKGTPSWDTRKFTDPYQYNGETRYPSNQKFLLLNGLTQIGSVDTINNVAQALAFEVDINSVLTDGMRRRLENGRPVKMSWLLYMRGNERRGSEQAPPKEFAAGAYTLTFTIYPTASGILKLSQATLRYEFRPNVNRSDLEDYDHT